MESFLRPPASRERGGDEGKKKNMETKEWESEERCRRMSLPV